MTRNRSEDVHFGHFGSGRLPGAPRKARPGALFQASRWEVRRDRLSALLPVILSAALVVGWAAMPAIPGGAP